MRRLPRRGKRWRRASSNASSTGEIEIFERDGVRAMRQRPCAARLAIHMLERAMAGRDKAAAAISAVKTAETEE